MSDFWCGICGGENPTCPNCHPDVPMSGYVPFARTAVSDVNDDLRQTVATAICAASGAAVLAPDDFLPEADAAIAAVLDALIAEADGDRHVNDCQECGGPAAWLRSVRNHDE